MPHINELKVGQEVVLKAKLLEVQKKDDKLTGAVVELPGISSYLWIRPEAIIGEYNPSQLMMCFPIKFEPGSKAIYKLEDGSFRFVQIKGITSIQSISSGKANPVYTVYREDGSTESKVYEEYLYTYEEFGEMLKK